MSESGRKIKDIPFPTARMMRDNDYVAISADGYFYALTPEMTSLSFYVDHDEWEFDGSPRKAKVTGMVRKLRFEVRLPTSTAYLLAKTMVENIETLEKGKRRVGPLEWHEGTTD